MIIYEHAKYGDQLLDKYMAQFSVLQFKLET